MPGLVADRFLVTILLLLWQKWAGLMGHVHVGVDTNIFLHFGNVEDLKWENLFPGVTAVSVYVCAQVQKELDNHKDTSSGYMRKRTRQYQQLLRSAEADEGYVHRSRSGAAQVEFVFLDRPRDSELDGEAFDLMEDDSRIVAQLMHEAKARGITMLLLANDARPLRVARQQGMRGVRPDAWEEDRSEPDTPEIVRLRAENRELQARIGAHPSTIISRIEETLEQRIFDGFDDAFDAAGFLESLKQNLLACHELPTPREVAERHHVVRQPFGLDIEIGGVGRVTGRHIDRYAEELEAFDRQVEALGVQDLMRLLQRLSLVSTVAMHVKNEGTRPDEAVAVEMDIRSSARFIDPEAFYDLTDFGIELPSPPEALDIAIPNIAEQLAARHAHDHRFVDVSDESSERSKRFLCKQFQHGTEEKFVVPFVPPRGEHTTVIEVAVRSRYLPQTIVRRIRSVVVLLKYRREHVIALLKDPHGLIAEELRSLVGRALVVLEGADNADEASLRDSGTTDLDHRL